MPEISVIVLNWNGKHFLEDCLGSLRRQTFRDFETILVDNGSSDGSVEFAHGKFPEVRILALPDNVGFAGGNIAGYEQSTGNLILLLNNDTEAHPKWLEEIRNASLTYPQAGSFASKMMYFHDRNRVENCGFDVGIEGATVDLGRGQSDGPQWSQPREVFGGCAGAAAYRRTMLEDVGFLDNDFFMTYEDVDLSFRAQLRGHDCVYVPGAVVYHHYRATNNKMPGRQVFYSQRNIDYVWLKNMPFGLMLRWAPWRLMYELGAAIYFTRLGAGAVFLRSKWEVLRHLPSLLRKRKEIQRRRVAGNAEIQEKLRNSIFEIKWRKLRGAWGGTMKGTTTG
jgi:hypothetical protein